VSSAAQDLNAAKGVRAWLLRRLGGRPAPTVARGPDEVVERVIDGNEYKVSADEFRQLITHQQRYELREQWFTLAGLALPYLTPTTMLIVGGVLALNHQSTAAYFLLSGGGVSGGGLALSKIIRRPAPGPPAGQPDRG
jgi:hypothetical protein